MNRYKEFALGIVRRWYLAGDFIVDIHVTPDMLTDGCMIPVAGSQGSGKTSFAAQIAKRLHGMGCRAPALIDEIVQLLNTMEQDYPSPAAAIQRRRQRPYLKAALLSIILAVMIVAFAWWIM